VIALVLDHLWQSTLFAGGAALVTLLLQANAARVRFWLWFAASLKFLVRFAALTARRFSYHEPSSGYVPDMGLISMTSMEDCGICRWGWFENASAAASCVSASTIEYSMMSFLVSEIPFDVTRFVFPPALVSTIISE
jgi:hypothetical protein